MIPNIKDLVTGNKKVYFHHFAGNELWYQHEGGFQFPIPLNDTGEAYFNAEDKALLYMRWMNRHIQFLRYSEDVEAQAVADKHTLYENPLSHQHNLRHLNEG